MKDRFVIGLQDEGLSSKQLIPDLKLNKVLEMAQSCEQVRVQMENRQTKNADEV